MPRLSTTATNTSPHIAVVDLDDAKYDRRLKRTLLRRRKHKRHTSYSYVVLVVCSTCMLLFIVLSIRHRQAQTQHDTHHRLQRAQHLMQQQQQDQDDDVAKIADPAAAFADLRETDDVDPTLLRRLLDRWLELQDQTVQQNLYTAERWTRPYLLPPLPDPDSPPTTDGEPPRPHRARLDFKSFFAVSRLSRSGKMAWEDEMQQAEPLQGPAVDYTDPDLYAYPELLASPEDDDNYPPLQTLQRLMDNWPQDQDFDGAVFEESLLHFNYSDPDQLQMAETFRDAEIPFKLYNVPDVAAAGAKWTDDYVSRMFDSRSHSRHSLHDPIIVDGIPYATADGQAQESTTNYFAFFVPQHWYVPTFGLPPTRNNDWTFATWARHARYADSVRLDPGHPHFYWQAGVPRDERYAPPDQWSFITRDLPSLSTVAPNFLVFHPESQKGIQCRFGERGVVAATHYDGGRNMVAMLTGAKRYILSPPHQCSRLGIFTERTSPIYRHSLLNFGHLNTEDSADNGMSPEEQAWLERAADSRAVETVLKAGEVLYIPSHWFHYIVSLQKSAQCNVRSGMEHEGNPRFGGQRTVEECLDDHDGTGWSGDSKAAAGAEEY